MPVWASRLAGNLMRSAISLLILLPALATPAFAIDVPAEAVRKSEALILARGGGMGDSGGTGGSIQGVGGGGMNCAGCSGGQGGMNGGNGGGATGGMAGGSGAGGGMGGAAQRAGPSGGSLGGLFGFTYPANAAESTGQDKDKLERKRKLRASHHAKSRGQ